MDTKTLTRTFKFFIALAMSTATLTPQAAFGAEECKPLKECKKKVDAWQAQQGVVGASANSGAQNINQGGARVSQAGAQTAAVACPAKAACEKAKKDADKDTKCKDKDKKEIEKLFGQASQGCDGAAAAAAGGAQTQSASDASGGRGSNGSGSGDNSGMMMAMLGAGMLAAMMMKKNQDNQQNQQTPQMPYTGALQANGSIDCSKADALVYRDCNAQMENRCRTILDDPTCQQFSSRYCGPTSGANAQITVAPQTPPGVILGVDPSTLYGSGGEGMGSQYCRGVTAWNYCKTAGRQSCPSCQQIQRNQSAQCAANPSLCLAQNSTAEIDRARGSCPTDPVFADPAVAASGGASAVTVNTGGSALPAVVLPQSVGANSGAGAGPSGSGSGGGASAGGISTQSVSSGNPNEQGTREGYGPGVGSQEFNGGSGSLANANYAGGGGVAGGTLGSSGREFASAGGMRPTSAVTNEIEGQYGPSLFNSTSQVIRRRCQAGRLNNCP